jgi:predicted permease
MDRFWNDLRFAVRTLTRRPLFVVTVVATLGLGIGGVVALFSVARAVLMRPLPYPDGDAVVVLSEPDDDGSSGTTSFATIADWTQRSRSFAEISMVRGWTVTLTGEGDPEQVGALRVSSSFFDVLGVQPMLGRSFRPDDDDPTAERVVVLGHDLWRRRFGADPSIIGRAVTLTGSDYTVIGVMPDTFEPLVSTAHFQRAEIWSPLRYSATDAFACRTCRHLRAVGRLAPGVDVERASAELGELTRELAREHPADYGRPGAVVRTLRDQLAGPVRLTIQVLLAAVALVLLIACANVASLVLTRSTAQRRETSLRTALGASRGSLVAQTLTECVLLALGGGALGTALGAWGTELLIATAPAGVPGLEHVELDTGVVAFGLGLALLTAVLFGVGPALYGARAEPADALREGSRSSAGRGLRRARAALVVSDVALALVLLVGVGLTLRSFLLVLGVDPGFDPEGVVVTQVNALGPEYVEEPAVVALHREISQSVLAIPGVETVGMSSQLPLGGSFDRAGLVVEGRPVDGPALVPDAERYAIVGDYLSVLRIPLLRGRALGDQDREDTSPVALVNETLARRYWPDEDALGGRIRLGGDDAAGMTVVGSVGDVRPYRLEEAPNLQVYVPQSQFATSYMTLAARTSGDPTAVADGLRRAVWAVDADLAVPAASLLEEVVSGATAQRRFVLGLLSVFAGLAILLTMVGIYGLLAYHVEQRRQEIGIRVALGAARGDVFRLVVVRGLGLTLVGVAVGLVGALALTRFIAAMLFGVAPTDALTLVTVTALMLGVSLLACWLPARRAARVDAPLALAAE